MWAIPHFSPDGKRLVLTHRDSPARAVVYDWQTGKVSHTLDGHSADVTAFAFSKDGKTLATGSADTTVLLWDLGKE